MIEIHQTIGIAVDRYRFETSHCCTGGIGTMSRGGNEDLGASGLPAAFVVSLDDQESSIFAMSTCCRLQCKSIHSGNLRQAFFQLFEYRQSSLTQFGWS